MANSAKTAKNRGVVRKLENWKTPFSRLSGFQRFRHLTRLEVAGLLCLRSLRSFLCFFNFTVFQFLHEPVLFCKKVRKQKNGAKAEAESAKAETQTQTKLG